MEILFSFLGAIFSLLLQPLPGAGLLIVVAIIVTWLLNRSRFKAAKTRQSELAVEIDELKCSLDINRKVHEEGERSLMGKTVQLQQELENALSDARFWKEKPAQREWERLRRCETVVKRIALTDPNNAIEMEKGILKAREELVQCDVAGNEAPNSRPSFFRRLLPGVR